MKLVRTLAVCAALAMIPSAMAQRWELGAGAGAGFYTSHDITTDAGTASSKIKTNVAISAWIGNNNGNRWGGELRYDYQRGDLQLTQGSTEASLGGDSHALHYDFLYHFADRDAHVRPYVNFGAGIKIYRGTGSEVAYQPLYQIALLTKGQDLKPVVSVGAGFKVKLSEHTQLRVSVNDFLTPFPKEVITPNGGSIDAWFNDIVPMIGLAYTH